MNNFTKWSCLIIFFTLISKLSALNINDNVPNFEAIDSNDKIWKLENFRNKKFVLMFFYPAAMTGGCTKQVCSYRDSHDQWKNKNVEIVGISGDQVKNLTLFRKAEKIPFTLLSDPSGKIASLFNVPTKKGGVIERFYMGNKYTLSRGVTSMRWTFLISKSGKVIYKNDEVDPSKDSQTVLEFIDKLK